MNWLHESEQKHGSKVEQASQTSLSVGGLLQMGAMFEGTALQDVPEAEQYEEQEDEGHHAGPTMEEQLQQAMQVGPASRGAGPDDLWGSAFDCGRRVTTTGAGAPTKLNTRLPLSTSWRAWSTSFGVTADLAQCPLSLLHRT